MAGPSLPAVPKPRLREPSLGNATPASSGVFEKEFCF